MRPRAELALGAGLLLVLGIGAAVLGSRRARVADTDQRRSTYLAGPGGSRGYADALEALGVEVVRHRRGVDWLDSLPRGTLVAVLDPTVELSAEEARSLTELEADLLVAGPAADPVARCVGYRIQRRSQPARVDGFPRVNAQLVPHLATSVTDSTGRMDGRDVTCTVAAPVRTDTLLSTRSGRLVAVALTYASERRVTVVAEDGLFANRALRETDAGPFALGLVVPRYRRAVFDERHHGFEIEGSLAGATLDWSLRSPWGWAVWQLAIVGLLALLASGVRFGPVRQVIVRRRRSPLEHVRALATALAAARGHAIAVRLIAQGLRRRLARGGRPVRGGLERWLDELSPSLRTERGRSAHQALTGLTARETSSDDVLRAADAVETLWEELKPG